MNNSTESLLVYLESQAVVAQGFVNQEQLTPSDRKTIEYWKEEGLLKIEPLPPPRGGTPMMHTHKITLTEELWNEAQKARRRQAERHRPFKKPDPQDSNLRLAKNGTNGQVKVPKPEKNVDFEHFMAWLENNNNSLSLPQEKCARQMFAVLNDPANRLMVTQRGAGQSWLFKAIDQYLTLIKNHAFKPDDGHDDD